MLDFKVLASSSAGCAYKLSGGGAKAPLLIDCGLPFKQLQRALDFKLSELAGCLISHCHLDHCKAYKELMAAGVRCYASRETWEALPATNYDHNREVLETKVHFLIGNDWNIMPFDAVHDAPGTFGYVVAAPDGSRLLYLTDSAYSKFTFPGLTHIAIECNHSEEILRANSDSGKIDHERFNRTYRTHMSLERLIDMLNANDLSKCQEIHLLHLSDDNSSEAEFKDAVQKATGIPTYVAAR